jgi:predicted restriction endonuclease
MENKFRYVDDFSLDMHIEVISAFLKLSKSHREIQKNILGIPAPARGGGFIAMDILHYYDIRDNKKGILKTRSIESELENSSERYKSALKLLIDSEKYKKTVADVIEGKYDEYSIPNGPTEFNRNVTVRIGQDILRKRVLLNYRNKCALCNVDIEELLICSHIVPWAIDTASRLNPRNAICLCSWHDSLFDKGYISIDDNYNIILSNIVPDYLRKELQSIKYEYAEREMPGKEFIKYHRDNVFKQ